ncbi:MAG: DUF885 domain-containing protein [Acidobacteria bacterium]|nr:MAG: DUF885 domain-containing protein [Acidobacteriota bacterium]
MNSRLTAALLVVGLSVGCSGASAPPEMTGDKPLGPILHGYVVEFLRRNPTTSTYLGGAGFDPQLSNVDGALRDYSVAGLAEEDRWLKTTQAALAAILPATLSPNAAIDREVALAQIAFMLRQHEIRKYQERALDTYMLEPFRAIDWQLQGLSSTGGSGYGTDAEWQLVVARVKQIPAFLDVAAAQLRAGVAHQNVPDRRMIRRDGIGTAESTAKYFASTLPALGAERMTGPAKAARLAELKTASAAAAAAYTKARNAVAALYFTDASAKTLKPEFDQDRYAMGETEYNWALTNNLRLDKNAATLFEESWPVVEATQKQMIALAREIGAAHTWTLPADGGAAVRFVFDQLSKDYPKSDTEMVAWYRDAAFRLVAFARRTGLFDVPADYKLDVTETPPPLQASIDGAAYYPAPPFKNTGVGRFYVTPTHNDPAALQSNNRAALADLSAHEGFPGHDWYYKVMTSYRDLISPVRWLTPGAVEDSSAMWEDSLSAEGWGLYAEALMAEPQPGAPNGFYTPEERLYQLQGQLYRDLRVRIDTGIHTGRLTYDAAASLFSEVVDFLPGTCAAFAPSGASAPRQALSEAKRASCDAAERAIFRYSKWPTQAITYRLGKAQIYALREDAQKLLGSSYSAKAFHLAFIRQGTIPSGYFKATLLTELSPGKK